MTASADARAVPSVLTAAVARPELWVGKVATSITEAGVTASSEPSGAFPSASAMFPATASASRIDPLSVSS